MRPSNFHGLPLRPFLFVSVHDERQEPRLTVALLRLPLVPFYHTTNMI